jgi:O-acetyl-ADP-ribose deacetylase (regulator of RNase III)
MRRVARIEIREGDLTEAAVDAIVNAANTDLVLGGGLAGAIRAKGGPEIQQECDRHGPVPLGGAALTGAGRLPARHVIHAAGMRLGGQMDEPSLRACTRRSLELAAEHGLRSLAFPAIGTGIGGFSMRRCAEVMLEEVHRFLEQPSSLVEIRFVLLGEPAYRVFEEVADSETIRRQLAKLPR